MVSRKQHTGGVVFDGSINIPTIITAIGLVITFVTIWVRTDEENHRQNADIAEIKSVQKEMVKAQQQLTTDISVLSQLVKDLKDLNANEVRTKH